MLPSIEDILKLRKNLQTMRILCDHFLPCVIGKKWWKMQILSGRHVNNITTVSDEAFVLLVLENIWDDMMKVNIDEYYRPKKGEKQEDEEGTRSGNSPNAPTNDKNKHDDRKKTQLYSVISRCLRCTKKTHTGAG